MTNTEPIRDYFKRFFSGKARHSDVRQLLTDDFKFRDLLMSANSADEYVDRLKSFGDVLDLRVDVKEIVGEGDIVAALVDFNGPASKMAYAQWFTFRDGKIAALHVIHDPRPFIDTQPRK
jgi:ketosteroid isomerase-like protein